MSYSRSCTCAFLAVMAISTSGGQETQTQQIPTTQVAKYAAPAAVPAKTESTGNPPAPPAKTGSAESSSNSESPLTFHGITLFGVIDVGLISESDGRPYNSNFGTGFETIIAPNGNEQVTHYADNGLTQSIIGLRGDVPLGRDVSLIFDFEPGFDPISMRFYEC